jgi:hypothetical protein
MVWNKKQIATFATFAHQEGWVAKLNKRSRDAEIFDGSLRYLAEKAGMIDRHPEEPENALDLNNKRKFKQIMDIL